MSERAESCAGDESERGCEFIRVEGGKRQKGEERVLQTRHDKGKCTYECTPDWLRDGFHGDQFAQPGEVVAAASTTATTAAAVVAAAVAAAVTTTTGAALPGKSYHL